MEKDNITVPNDLGWKRGEQLKFIMFIDRFWSQYYAENVWFVTQEIEKPFVAACLSNINKYAFVHILCCYIIVIS